MNKKAICRTVFYCILMLGLTALPGCSNQPTLGERMMQQGSGTAELGKQWSDGNEKIQEGEKFIKQGNEMIEDARENMREGEDKVIKGKKLVENGKQEVEESELRFKNSFPAIYQKLHKTP